MITPPAARLDSWDSIYDRGRYFTAPVPALGPTQALIQICLGAVSLGGGRGDFCRSLKLPIHLDIYEYLELYLLGVFN